MEAASKVGQVFGFVGEPTERNLQAGLTTAGITAVLITSLMHYANWQVMPSASALMTSTLFGGATGAGLATMAGAPADTVITDREGLSIWRSQRGLVLIGGVIAGTLMLGINAAFGPTRLLSITQGSCMTLAAMGITWQITRGLSK